MTRHSNVFISIYSIKLNFFVDTSHAEPRIRSCNMKNVYFKIRVTIDKTCIWCVSVFDSMCLHPQQLSFNYSYTKDVLPDFTFWQRTLIQFKVLQNWRILQGDNIKFWYISRIRFKEERVYPRNIFWAGFLADMIERCLEIIGDCDLILIEVESELLTCCAKLQKVFEAFTVHGMVRHKITRQ